MMALNCFQETKTETAFNHLFFFLFFFLFCFFVEPKTETAFNHFLFVCFLFVFFFVEPKTETAFNHFFFVNCGSVDVFQILRERMHEFDIFHLFLFFLIDFSNKLGLIKSELQIRWGFKDICKSR